jgi:hypothetical protein
MLSTSPRRVKGQPATLLSRIQQTKGIVAAAGKKIPIGFAEVWAVLNELAQGDYPGYQIDDIVAASEYVFLRSLRVCCSRTILPRSKVTDSIFDFISHPTVSSVSSRTRTTRRRTLSTRRKARRQQAAARPFLQSGVESRCPQRCWTEQVWERPRDGEPRDKDRRLLFRTL